LEISNLSSLFSSSRFSHSKVKVKTDPTPSVDVTLIQPLNYSTSYLQMVNPKPIPFWFCCEVLLRFPNKLKRFGISDSLIPIPVSIIENSRSPFFEVINFAFILIKPI
jgi:hypothetical protein